MEKRNAGRSILKQSMEKNKLAVKKKKGTTKRNKLNESRTSDIEKIYGEKMSIADSDWDRESSVGSCMSR
jgi:hypothetical protein